MPVMARCLLLLFLLGPLAVSPLAERQWAQLQSARDGSPRLDEGALYPLLEHAAQWEPGDEAGATVPDYQAIHQSPADHRGQRFLIEGTLKRSRPWRTVRSGPWGETLTEWVIQHGRAPGEVAVVYFVQAGEHLPEARVGQRVRAVAAFYKVWSDRDQNAAPTDFLTFVGRSATVMERGSAGPGAGMAMGLILLVVVVLIVVFWRVRGLVVRSGGAGRAGGKVTARQADRLREDRPAAGVNERHGAPNVEQGSPLPRDPADALAELSRRREGRREE